MSAVRFEAFTMTECNGIFSCLVWSDFETFQRTHLAPLGTHVIALAVTLIAFQAILLVDP
jgi:hypothetical protein